MMCKQISFTNSDTFTRDEIRALYDSVGWISYTRNLDTLMTGLVQSTRVVTARHGGELIGLCRLISDSATIVYVQDVLVCPKFQRAGVGSELLRRALEPYSDVQQKVLLTDNEPWQRAFYEKHGFTEIRDVDGAQLRSFVQFDGI